MSAMASCLSSRAVQPFTSCRQPRRCAKVRTTTHSLNHTCRHSWRLYAEPEPKTPAPDAPQSSEREEELPPWVRREQERKLQKDMPKELVPWPLYLLLSLFTLIAAVGSFFEYANKNPVFGVVGPDSPLWAPILGLFAFTGLPMGAFLFFKGVDGANKAAELQDRMDGYMD